MSENNFNNEVITADNQHNTHRQRSSSRIREQEQPPSAQQATSTFSPMAQRKTQASSFAHASQQLLRSENCDQSNSNGIMRNQAHGVNHISHKTADQSGDDQNYHSSSHNRQANVRSSEKTSHMPHLKQAVISMNDNYTSQPPAPLHSDPSGLKLTVSPDQRVNLASKRLNSSEKQKRYKLSPSISNLNQGLQINRQVLFKPNIHDDVGAQTTINPNQIYQSPKFAQQRLIPERESHQRHSSQVKGQQQAAVKTTQQSRAGAELESSQSKGPPGTILGLGLGMGIQMGHDGRFYASMGGQTMPTANTEPLSPHTGKVGQQSLIARQRLSQAQNISFQNNQNGVASGSGLDNSAAKKPLGSKVHHQPDSQKSSPRNGGGQQNRDSQYLRGNLNDYQEIFNQVASKQRKSLQKSTQKPFSQENSETYQIQSPSNHNDKRQKQLMAALENEKAGTLQTDFYQANVNLGNAATSNTQVTSISTKKYQRMNSTNESNFTEQPLFSHQQLIDQNLDAAAASSFSMENAGHQGQIVQQNNQIVMQSYRNGPVTSQNGPMQLSKLDKSYHTTQVQSPSKQQTSYLNHPSDTRSFILMKNKVEENSKQLKHDVAQQIIAASMNKGSVSDTTKTRINSHHARKTSIMTSGQDSENHQLPPLRQQTVPKSEVLSPHGNSTAYFSNDQLAAESSRVQNQQALGVFYQQITSDQISLSHQNNQTTRLESLQNKPSQPSSQLSKNPKKSQLNLQSEASAKGVSLQKHNSMEHLLVSKIASRNNLSMHLPPPQIVGINQQDPNVNQVQAAVYQSAQRSPEQASEIKALHQSASKNQQGLSYRVLSEKRASQPPLMGDEDSRQNHQRSLLKQHVEHLKRNSVHVVTNGGAAAAVPQQNYAFLLKDHQAEEQLQHQMIAQSQGFNQNQIFKQEVTVEKQGAQMMQTQDANITHENAAWIKKAIEASHQKLAESNYLNQLQKTQDSHAKNQKPVKQYMSMGSPKIYIPQMNVKAVQRHEIDSPKKPDLTDSNVKRSRLLLEKKKKQFEQQKDPRWRLHDPTVQQQILAQQMQVQQQQQLQYGQMEKDVLQHNAMILANNGITQQELMQNGQIQQTIAQVGGNLVCIPNITYKSILPTQKDQKHSKQIKNLGEHPLNSQQLLNGYSKNMAAAQGISKPIRKAYQEKAFQQNQGIQGRNITIMTQNKALHHQQQLQKQDKHNQLAQEQIIEQSAVLEALEAQLNPDDFKALQIIQQQLQNGANFINNSQSRKNLLQAMHAAETNQMQPGLVAPNQYEQQMMIQGKQKASNSRQSNFFHFGAQKGQKQSDSANPGRMIVFTHNGQTYIRNPYSDFVQGVQGIAAEPNEIGEQDLTKLDPSYLESLAMEQQEMQNQRRQSPVGGKQPISQATYMADQMVQLSIGSRSLSKMLQGAQLEAALQQLSQSGAFSGGQNNLDSATYISQVTLNQPQQSPRSIMKIRGRSEKNSKIKVVSPQKTGMRAGESNGSLSTKPATSTTINSQQRKDGEESKQNLTGKKGKGAKKQEPLKQRIHIFHEWDENSYKSHKINKAINTINNIIRLIFKNNKDSLAITTTNNTSSLSGPPNRLADDHKIQELQKIAKQININIPRKFDSKASLREFFHSREFILNLKIKMQNLLHKAILTANNLPMSVIEANMCGNQTVNVGNSSGKEESKIYQAKKFYVGPGNNFPIVKSVLKQRYWWQYGSEESFASDCDFIWTSWKKQKLIDQLGSINDKQKAKVQKAHKQQLQSLAKSNASVDTRNSHDAEQKMMNSTETKMSRKKKEKGAGGEAKEQTYSQAHIDKIVLPLRLYNRLEQNKQLTNKKGVFVNMRKYYESLGQDPFKVLPLTFHTSHGINDTDYRKFSNYYNALEQKNKQSEIQIKAAIKQYQTDKKEAAKKPKSDEYDSEVDSDDEDAIEKIRKKYRTPLNTWIIKPGENSNRGVGITVVKTIREVQSIIGRPTRKDGDRTFIIQKYIDYPLLVHKRKFDFRCFGLLTSINGSLKGYCYQDGYIRTSCREYNLDDVTDQLIHLTNDAIQQKADDYGKFENGNKMSFQDFTKVITAQQPELDFDFMRDLFPQIQKLIADTYKAAFHKIDPQRLQNTFELFGYDFMVDEDFRLYLIEVNTNPCLEVCCPLLARIIPELLDNSFKIVLDPLFPSPDLSHNRKFQLNELPQEVKFQLVFDEDVEGEEIRANFLRGVKGSIREAVGEEDIESDKEQELAEDDAEEAY